MPTPGDQFKLKQKTWTVLGPLGADKGGFGDLYTVKDEASNEAVAKLVKKAPAADREALIGVANAAAKHPNVVPVIDDGEFDDNWVLVMPRAEISLKKYLDDRGGSLDPMEAVAVMIDVATALRAIKGVVVHRDLKPANILRWNGAWSLTDFGLARYADEATGTETWKEKGTVQYASPEQWRGVHATEAADVYAFGIVAYEMLAGQRPFAGPDFRHQHLSQTPPPLAVGSTPLRILVEDCLEKLPEARPSPALILQRLKKIAGGAPTGAGLEILAQANRSSMQKQAEAHARWLTVQQHAERTAELHDIAARAFQHITDELIDAIQTFAPAAELLINRVGGRLYQTALAFTAQLERATFDLYKPHPSITGPATLPLTVASESTISVRLDDPLDGWLGRSHSLWYCNALEVDRFAWYEVAFTTTALIPLPAEIDPFDMEGARAGPTLYPGISGAQVAWDFEELDRSDLSEFVNRWLGWFGAAALGQLQRPAMLPEKPVRADRWWN